MDSKQVTCSKEKPWDGKTVPIIHLDAGFVEDTDMVRCPNCNHTWVMRDFVEGVDD